MSKSAIILLKEHYLSHLKENPELLIGIELELPIVNTKREAVDLAVSRALLHHLVTTLDFDVEKYDLDGNPIQLVKEESQDRILFEVSYTTLEFAFGPVKTLLEVEKRFETYLSVIQDFLCERGHLIVGQGLNPQWATNDNQPVKSPRYQMLMDYLALGKNYSQLHSFPQYGAFICGSQVQLDVSRSNFYQVINAFNQIEAAKAYLFANSTFDGTDWDTRISRDIFWEASMHGLLTENVGVNAVDFATEEDFFDYLSQSAMFTVQRQGRDYYFPPVSVVDYFSKAKFEAVDLHGDKTILQPLESDIESHRSYQFQSLTKRGTVEFRSVCAQPLDRTFAPAAFHLGLLVELETLEHYLATAPFFTKWGRNYKALRRQFSKKELTAEEKSSIQSFSKDLLKIAKNGLLTRGFGEELYLSKIQLH